SVLLNDSAVSVHNDPILSDKSFNGFGVVRHNRVLEIFLELQQLLNRFVIHASACDLSVSNEDISPPIIRRSSNFHLDTPSPSNGSFEVLTLMSGPNS